jgi:hypothetical protein
MKHDDAPYRRWHPQRSWLSVHFHPPVKGCVYTVRERGTTEQFYAYLYYDGSWIKVAEPTWRAGMEVLGHVSQFAQLEYFW